MSHRISTFVGARHAICALALVLVGGVGACGPERPPSPESSGSVAARGADVPKAFDLETKTFILTYASDRGSFADTQDPADVPARARGMVRVVFSDGRRAPPGLTFVTNLDASSDGGSRRGLETVPLELFEELALGRGLSSQVKLPGGLEAPPPAPPAEDVVVYKTAWCGVCKKAMAYLDRKGIPYVARDVETDVGAASELRAKADRAGVATGSVPIIDVRGTLMVGFDRDRLESLL